MPPDEVLIAEAPYHYEWHRNHFFFLQRLHRQGNVVGEVNALTRHDSPAFRADDPRARFANSLPIHDLSRLLARGVRYVVLHTEFAREVPAWEDEPRTDMAPVVRYFRRRCGEPTSSEELVEVFDLHECAAARKLVDGSHAPSPGLRD